MAKSIDLSLWKDLYDAAGEFKALAPWQWMYDSDIFGVQNPETGEMGYCCIMGRAGEHFAMAVYPGEKGLFSFFNLLRSADEINPDPDLLFDQNCIKVSFEDRKDMDSTDRRIMKKLNLKFRGRTNWPLFRRFSPGYFPWFLSEDEIRFLTIALQQAIEVTPRFRENPELLRKETKKSVKIFTRLAEKANGNISWKDAWQAPVFADQPSIKTPPVDQIRLRSIGKNLKPSDAIWEFDTWYFPNPIQEKKDERPYYPVMLGWANQSTGMILQHEMSTKADYPNHVQQQFYKILEKINVMPREIWVQKDDCFDILEPLCQAAGIKLELYDGLIAIETIKAFLMSRFS